MRKLWPLLQQSFLLFKMFFFCADIQALTIWAYFCFYKSALRNSYFFFQSLFEHWEGPATAGWSFSRQTDRKNQQTNKTIEYTTKHRSFSHPSVIPLHSLNSSQMGEVACYTPLCPECKKPPPGGGSSKEVKVKPKKNGNQGPSKWGLRKPANQKDSSRRFVITASLQFSSEISSQRYSVLG